MSKQLLMGLALVSLLGCVSLPGSDTTPSARYTLNSTTDNCGGPGTPLGLSVAKLGVGLDTDRIARRDSGTGEMTYLGNVRWVEPAGRMLEQRLANDLECKGYTIITSHHNTLSHDQLVCEVRAFNLIADAGNDGAEVGLSCVLFVASGDGDKNIRTLHKTTLSSWRASSATAAMSASYQRVLQDITTGLKSASVGGI